MYLLLVMGALMVIIGKCFIDKSNFDGYTNSIYTVTVAAMDHLQAHPWYSERCSAILLSAYSAKKEMEGIYTTDWKTGCTSSHGGTSAAAPLVSGVYALLLQIR
jgi:kexin